MAARGVCPSLEPKEAAEEWPLRCGGLVLPVAGDDDVGGALRVVAYYAWCMAQLAISEAPDRLRKGGGRYPQPVALQARLGVDVEHEGMGLGAGLLADVIARISGLSAETGCRGLLVHAESRTARDFYIHLVPEFEQSQTDALHLVLMIKDIRRSLGL